MATRKIGPALAAGCTVVLKPASDTPLTALLMARDPRGRGRAAGVVNVLPGPPVRRGGLGDAARPAGAQAVVHRQHRGRPGAAEGGGGPGRQLLDGARRQRAVPGLRRRRPRRRRRRRDGRQDAQRRRGLHGGEPLLRRGSVAEEFAGRLAERMSAAARRARHRRRDPGRPAGQRRRRGEGPRARRRRGRRGRPRASSVAAAPTARASTTNRPCSSTSPPDAADPGRGDLRSGRPDRHLHRRGRGGPAGQRHRVRPGLLRLHRRPRPRPAA